MRRHRVRSLGGGQGGAGGGSAGSGAIDARPDTTRRWTLRRPSRSRATPMRPPLRQRQDRRGAGRGVRRRQHARGRRLRAPTARRSRRTSTARTRASRATYLVKCGDGVLGGIEQCDPPNVGRGCSATCRLEPGYVCDAPPRGSGSQPSRPPVTRPCAATATRRARRRATTATPSTATAARRAARSSRTAARARAPSTCGDGVKLAPEACDDGNTQDGDGCSHDCKLEAGFTCTDAPTSPPAQLNLARRLPRLHQLPDRRGRRATPTSRSSRAWGSRRCW